MVSVVLDPSLDALLRQTAADLELSVDEVARILLASSLLSSMTR